MIFPTYFLSLLSVLFFSAPLKSKIDLLVLNARVYTLSPNNTIVEAIAVNDGKIVFIGSTSEAELKFESEHKINLEGKSVFPGLIDAHCHFYGLGEQMNRANLVTTKSWNEVIEFLKIFSLINKEVWIQGRGWDQNDWVIKEFPTNDLLNIAYPDQPVFIKRIDGHAAVANDIALKIGGFTINTKIFGGELKIKNGKLTGVLIDNAMDSLEKFIPASSEKNIIDYLLSAQEKCFAVGLTTVSDAGLDKRVIDIIDSMQRKNLLKMRVYAMLADNEINRNYYFKNGTYKTDRLVVNAFKFYIDGALGSRGALLKKSYSDQENYYGLLLKPKEYFSRKFAECAAEGFQVCAHAIGDSANKLTLELYGQSLIAKNNKRWRIEHAQVVSPENLNLFDQYSIIPSIQPCFATSDMYWAEERIGTDRINNSYSWKSLLQHAGMVACGSDFPIENINPLHGFYAAISRMDQKQFPAGGFIPQQKLTRIEALNGMTIWAAYANFMENEVGSLTVGKQADFIVLDNDIMSMPEEEIFKTKVLMTYLNGELVFIK